jgi:hypothetical protein
MSSFLITIGGNKIYRYGGEEWIILKDRNAQWSSDNTIDYPIEFADTYVPNKREIVKLIEAEQEITDSANTAKNIFNRKILNFWNFN